MEKRGKDMQNLRAALLLLIHERPLAVEYRDHALRGDWAGHRDLHIEPDWLLLYRVSEGHLSRTDWDACRSLPRMTVKG